MAGVILTKTSAGSKPITGNSLSLKMSTPSIPKVAAYLTVMVRFISESEDVLVRLTLVLSELTTMSSE